MSIKPILVLLVLLLAACSPTSKPTDSPTSKPTDSPTSMPTDSGIEGDATIGPMCPVVQVNNPCPDKPYQATITVLTTDRQKIIQFQTDPNGHFQVKLAPGKYILHPESPHAMPPRAADMPFTVNERQFTRMDVVYDSGIR